MDKQRFRIDKNEKLIALLEKRVPTVTNNYPTSNDSDAPLAPQNIMGKPVIVDTIPRDRQVLVYDEENKEWKASNKNILKVVIVTDTYTVLAIDETIVCNKVTPFTVTLPTAVVGTKFEISNINIGDVTVEGIGSDTIDEELNQIVSYGDTMNIRCYLINKWKIV